MAHLVHAAQQLLREVEDIGGGAEALEEVDGLGFCREVRIDNETVKKMGPALEALEADDRVAEVVRSSKGARVVFVPDPRADHADEFGLASVVPAQEG